MSFVTNNIADYDTRKAEFEALKDTLPKEPSGDVKKEYCVGCFQKSDWEFIHEELMKDGSLEDNIPTDKCECINDCLQSDVRGVYLLTDTEATELKGNSKVDYVHINSSAYPGTYAPNPDDLLETTSFRYSSTVKNQQEVTTTSGGILENLNSDKLNRCSSQLYRHTAKKNPWVTLGNPQTVVSNRLEKYGTGVDVDVIVCDTDMWFGHIEFQDPDDITNIKTYDASQPGNVGGSASTVAPSDFVGGNVRSYPTISSLESCQEQCYNDPLCVTGKWEDSWKIMYKIDESNNIMENVGKVSFNAAFWSSEFRILKRTCQLCSEEDYKEIYYARDIYENENAVDVYDELMHTFMAVAQPSDDFNSDEMFNRFGLKYENID